MMQTYRVVRAKAARTSAIRAPWVWSWHLGLKPEDKFLASFPRSGSTWLRFMLFETLFGEDAGFKKIEDRLPEIHRHRGSTPILAGGGRLIKTHENYRNDYQRAVLLIRDIRDVFLSCWAGYDALGLAPIVSKGDMDSFLVAFLEGKAIHSGSWQQHTKSWLESPIAKNGNLLVIKYEDLRKNPEPMLQELLEFVGMPYDVHAIRRAIENNTLQQMRKKEEKEKQAGEHSILLGDRKRTDDTGRFVRKGAVAGWRSKMTPAQLKVVDQYAGDLLTSLGYELGGSAEQQISSEAHAVTV
jgi:Sulfotransferase domain